MDLKVIGAGCGSCKTHRWTPAAMENLKKEAFRTLMSWRTPDGDKADCRLCDCGGKARKNYFGLDQHVRL